VLAVKPAYLSEVLEQIKDHLTEDHLVLSIVAGVSIETIAKQINNHKRIGRLMPNTPSLQGVGAGAFSMSDKATKEDA
jgi:pyrroline-5-carboxylate reductase